MTLANLNTKQIEALLDQLKFEAKREGCRLYKPYKKQKEFHAAGARFRERTFAAANQFGKSYSAAAEMAIHLTGEYPAWWEGRRWDRPVHAWCAGVTGESTRDTLQRLLMGRPGELGTGTIPAECIISHTNGRGVADAMDTVIVRNKFGGQSTLSFKSYALGREKWQGATLDIVAFDEEPTDPALYTEGLTRTNATGGMVWMTFTPLLGMSEIVMRFFQEKSPDRCLIQATIHDAEHYTPEERERIINSYPVHERDARVNGVPVLGSGRIFPVSDEQISCEPFAIPKHFSHIVGLDFGWDHEAAAAWIAWDRDQDVVYVYDLFKVRETSVVLQAPLIAAKGKWKPVSWPADGLQHDKGSGKTLASQFIELGVNMLPEHATTVDGGVSVEATVSELLNRMQTGRFKVFSHLTPVFDEIRLYHRVNGKINKIRDDAISAIRYATMMLRFATTEPKGPMGKVFTVNFGVRKGGY